MKQQLIIAIKEVIFWLGRYLSGENRFHHRQMMKCLTKKSLNKLVINWVKNMSGRSTHSHRKVKVRHEDLTVYEYNIIIF